MTVVAPQTAVERLTYPISPEYVKGWSAERAIAELVANAIDEDLDFSYRWTNGVLTIEDDGPGIPEHGMILGVSHKGDSQVGQFGEGKKIAALVLAREKGVGAVRFETVGYSFEPTIVRASFMPASLRRADVEAPEVLAYDIEACDRQNGTRITIECSENLAEAVKRRFLHFTPGYRAPDSPGRIMLGSPGVIYIGGVQVSTNDKLLFGYDFCLADAKSLQNRDRTVLDAWRVRGLITAALRNVEDEAALRMWVNAALDGQLDDAECSFLNPTPRQRVLLEKIGNDLMAQRYPGQTPCYIDSHQPASQEQLLDLADRGYVLVEAKLRDHQHRGLMKLLGVKSVALAAKSARSAKPKTRWVKDSALTASERELLAAASRIVRGVWGPQALDGLRVFDQCFHDSGYEDQHTGGWYEPRSGKIAIRRNRITNLDEVLALLVHEACHRLAHRAGQEYNDRTRGFEWQLGVMAAKAGRLLMDGGLVPDEAQLEAQAAAEAERCAQHPITRIAAIIDQRVAEAGYQTLAAYARSVGVAPAWARAATRLTRGGRKLPGVNAERLEALLGGLGMRWQVLALCSMGAGLPTVSRRKDGKPYGNAGRRLADLIEQVAAFEDTPQLLVDELRDQLASAAAVETTDDAWLAPYEWMVDVEVERLERLDAQTRTVVAPRPIDQLLEDDPADGQVAA